VVSTPLSKVIQGTGLLRCRVDWLARKGKVSQGFLKGLLATHTL